MKFHGLSDSLASFAGEPEPCPTCGNTASVQRGGCVRCLLASGLGEVADGADDFDAVLAEVEIPDREWRLGNYQILEEVGRGGMGVIYRARQRHSKRIVALKRVLSYHGDSRETLERFRREAEAAASLDHPNILPIYEVGEHDGLPFFTMKFATGGSLQQAAPALSADPRESIRLMAKVTRAVAHAHGAGILHRDLKPGNILLDGRGEPFVTDFGLAKWMDTTSDLTRSLAVFGTPGFIAPEQAQGPRADVGRAADLYSLGAILFDLLSGRAPFLGEHALAVIRQAAENTAPKLRSIVPKADRDLETVCAKCLERDPAARYRSATDLAEDLERWLEGRPIVARPVSLPVQAWRWSRRNPAVAISVSLGLIAGVVALGYQVRSRGFESDLHVQARAQHSVAILPFLNLDQGEPDIPLAGSAADSLRAAWADLGPSKVTALRTLPARWTGTANRSEVRDAGKDTESRTVLTGTRRQLGRGIRYSLHLVNANTNEPLQQWIVDTASGESLAGKLAATGLTAEIYRQLARPDSEPPSAASVDPAMENERARPFMITGQELLYRRNLADMDRAIACFEGAINAEPRSIAARCYLAFSLMGRDLLSSSPEHARRGLQVAHEAVNLAPTDPTANRAVCALATSQGDYPDALEHGIRALEYGDPSERAFGEIGYIWKMTGRPDRALRWFEKVRLTHQRPAECAALEGDCWAELGEDDRAREAYEAAAAFQPDQPDGWIGLCRLKILAGDYEAARAIYRRERPNYPQSPQARRIAAVVEFFAGNVPEAEERYRALESEDPRGGVKGGFHMRVDYRSALASLKLRQGQVDEAREILQDCLVAEEERTKAHPADPAAFYRKAAVQSMLGNQTEALADLRSAIAAGWIDYRATRLDPRFAALTDHPEFALMLAAVAKRVAALARDAVRPPLKQQSENSADPK